MALRVLAGVVFFFGVANGVTQKTINILYHEREAGWHDCPYEGSPQAQGCGLMPEIMQAAFPPSDGWVINSRFAVLDGVSWADYMQIFNKNGQKVVGVPEIDDVEWDIGGSLTTVTAFRANFTQFGTFWRPSGYRLITRVAEVKSIVIPTFSLVKMFWWLSPFLPGVWAFFLVITPLFAATVLFTMEVFSPSEHDDGCPYSKAFVLTTDITIEPMKGCEACDMADDMEGFPPGLWGVSLAVWYAYSVMFFTQDRNMRRPIGKFFAIVYQFTMMLWLTIYTSTLMAFIVVKRVPTVAVEKPSDFILADNVGCTIKSWATGEWLQAQNFPDTIWCKNIKECADWVEQDKCQGFVLDQGYGDILLQERCELDFSGELFNPVMFGSMVSAKFAKTAEYNEFNARMIRVISLMVPGWYEKYVKQTSSRCIKPLDEEPPFVIQWDMVAGLTTIFGGLTMLAAAIHVVMMRDANYKYTGLLRNPEHSVSKENENARCE